MKPFFLITLLLSGANCLYAQDEALKQSNIAGYFDEIEAATQKYEQLWNENLYAPILLVDRQSRRVFANEPDSAGMLTPDGNIYAGTMPKGMNFANTALNWSGKRWAMIMLPLPENKQNRINLLAHELFHRAQPVLGFVPRAAQNNHLDQKEGRVYLRLELEALKKALQVSGKEQHQHLVHALAFRSYRQSLYPGSDTMENNLELNEGLAEFTGAIVSGRGPEQMKEHLINSMDDFLGNPTFVRSFAYETIPAYGYLLYQKNKNWVGDITNKTHLTDYFVNAFKVTLPKKLKKTIKGLAPNYNGANIIAEETIRAKKNAERIAAYRKKLIEEPHFELPILIDLTKLSVAFDPRTILPLGDVGTVYPIIRVTDLWGILNVKKGALVTPVWKKISITQPTGSEGNKIMGDGWTLELAEGYEVQKDVESGNYEIVKE